MYIFIVNTKAGNGRAKRIFLKLKKTKLYQKIASTFYYTEYEGHAEEIVRSFQNTQDISVIIVIGGDGTLHEAINGMDHHVMPIAIIPGGSGNDFARGIGLKESPLQILKNIVEGRADSPYFLGNYIIDRAEERHFVNSMGFGFDALIAKRANYSFYKRIFNFFNIGK